MVSTDHCAVRDLQSKQPSTSTSSSDSLVKTDQVAESTTSAGLSGRSDATAVAAFPCALCPAVFADGLALAVHEREHGAALCCPFCARSFRLEGDLRRHQRRHGRSAGRTGHSAAEGSADNASVAGEQDHGVWLAEGPASPGVRTVEKRKVTELAVMGSVDTEDAFTETLHSLKTAATSERLAGKNEDRDGLTDDIPPQADQHPPLTENHAAEVESHPPQTENHTPVANDNSDGISKDAEASDTPELYGTGLANGSTERPAGDVLEAPFQCAVCHAQFSQVSLLQEHVEGHVPACRGRPPPVKEVLPRRSQRRRSARRPLDVSGNSDDIGGVVGDDDGDIGDAGVAKGGVTRGSSRSATAVPKRLHPGGKGAAKSGRPSPASAVTSGGSKSVEALPSSSGAVKRRPVAGSKFSVGAGPSRKVVTKIGAVEDDVPSGIRWTEEKAETHSGDQLTAPTTAIAGRKAQRNCRRRTTRPPIALMEDEEDDVDDAPVMSSPSPQFPPSSTVTSPTVEAVEPTATPSSAASTPIRTHGKTLDAVPPLPDEHLTPLLPVAEAKTGGAIAAAGERTEEVTEPTTTAPESEPASKHAPVPGEFECDVCHRRLAHRHALARHRQMHFARESYQCDQCPRRYSRMDSLVTHSRTHASEATYKCQRCPKAYRLRSLLEYHEREHQKEGATSTLAVEATRYECTECNKTFSYMTALRRHARLHVGGQRFYCELCPKRYSRLDVLILHSRVHSKLTPFECVICSRTFSQRRILEYHTSAHAGAMLPPFKCTLCARSFPDVAQLREHRLRHAPSRSFLCDMCGKEFKSANKLRRHVMTHTGERPLHCKVCDRRFVDGTSLTQHLRIHSGERPFQCHVCGKSFSRNVTLKIHARTHSGEKPYPCNVCGRAFTTVTQLRRHARVHSGERPYLCGVCGRGFSQTTHRKVHMRTHAPRPDALSDTRQPILEQQHHQQEQQQQQAVLQMASTQPPPSAHEAHQSALQLQHQQGQEHQELYALHTGLSIVGPLNIEEGNMTLHFMQQ